MIAPNAELSINRQCALLGVARSSFYHRPRAEPAEELDLLARLDRIFTDRPVYGSRRLQVALGPGSRSLGILGVKSRRNTLILAVLLDFAAGNSLKS